MGYKLSECLFRNKRNLFVSYMEINSSSYVRSVKTLSIKVVFVEFKLLKFCDIKHVFQKIIGSNANSEHTHSIFPKKYVIFACSH